jgi:hypothetical protein
MNFKAASIELDRDSNRNATIDPSQTCGFTAEPAMNAINRN